MLNCKVSVSILLAAFRNAIACFPKHPNPPLPPPPPEKASEERAQKFYKKKTLTSEFNSYPCVSLPDYGTQG